MVTLKYSIESVPVGDEAVELPKSQHNKPSSAAPWTVDPQTTPRNVNTGDQHSYAESSNLMDVFPQWHLGPGDIS